MPPRGLEMSVKVPKAFTESFTIPDKDKGKVLPQIVVNFKDILVDEIIIHNGYHSYLKTAGKGIFNSINMGTQSSLVLNLSHSLKSEDQVSLDHFIDKVYNNILKNSFDKGKYFEI